MRKFLVIAVAILFVAPAMPATAANWKLPFVDVAAMSVNQGSPVAVSFGVLYPSTCSAWLQSSTSKSKSVSYKVTKPQRNATLSTAGLPTGKYTVRVSCGKSGAAGKGMSDPVWIIAKGAPTIATCNVIDQGFAPISRGGVSYGVEVKNLSPVLTATLVTLKVSFQNASGLTIASSRAFAMDLAPGETAFAGGTEFTPGIAAMRIEPTCESTMDTPSTRVRGVGQAAAAEGVYDSKLTAVISNATTTSFAEFSPLAYVLRDSSGVIIGGGSSFLGLLLLPGATGTWKADSFASPSKVTTVSWVLDPITE